MRYSAVLFDFDGTLADSFGAITASVNHVRQHHGWPILTEEEVRGLVGHGLEHLMQQVAPGDPQHNAELYRQHHPQVMASLTRLLTGVEEGLPKLFAAGIKMAVCSNKPPRFTKQLVDELELAPFFTGVYGPGELKPKPDPEMIFHALKDMHTSPERALFVGDMTIDIETARNAGIAVWVLPTGSHDRATLEAAQPDRIFEDFHQLTDLLLSAD
jgi:phosphoglycolate phosphatase